MLVRLDFNGDQVVGFGSGLRDEDIDDDVSIIGDAIYGHVFTSSSAGDVG